MKNMTVNVVHHDHGGWSIRTTPVGKTSTEGPQKDCTMYEAVLSPKAARQYLTGVSGRTGGGG